MSLVSNIYVDLMWKECAWFSFQRFTDVARNCKFDCFIHLTNISVVSGSSLDSPLKKNQQENFPTGHSERGPPLCRVYDSVRGVRQSYASLCMGILGNLVSIKVGMT